uniref:Secreted protein n=1 Tax=Peronospora matthiolae TaxID=2874970 RepID=A0AAV1UL62_9STRA
MMFAYALPLMFWGDARLYAVHILNRSPTRATAKRASQLEVLTGKTSGLRGIVVFGSQCSVYRDPRKNDAPAVAVANDGRTDNNRATRKSRK